jgi:hypothetical protein
MGLTFFSLQFCIMRKLVQCGKYFRSLAVPPYTSFTVFTKNWSSYNKNQLTNTRGLKSIRYGGVLLSTPLHASCNFTPFAKCYLYSLQIKGDLKKKVKSISLKMSHIFIAYSINTRLDSTSKSVPHYLSLEGCHLWP